MRPDARVQSAIDVLDQWLASDTGLDRVLTDWGRANRFAGSKDRAAIADLVYGAVRRLRSANWVAGREDAASGRAALIGAHVLNDVDPGTVFSGERHAPSPITQAERAAIRDLEDAPRAIRFDYPDWLEQHLADLTEEDLDALRNRAATDLRVNTLKSNVDAATSALDEDDISTVAVPDAPLALRVTEGARRVARNRAYLDGLVEIQDAGSQMLAALANPQPGEKVLDLCAGGGGKALALAAASGGEAQVLAHDISLARMKDIPDRAERAGVQIDRIATRDLNALRGTFDLVFIDAPCSGSGAWRRNPDAKWRLRSERLTELTALQGDLLRQGASYCKPDGRIVYGTCSLFTAENMQVVQAFLSAAPEWQCHRTFRSRLADGMDGFFGAVLSRGMDSRIN